jgi:3-oxoacyl-(acyl-carrier-protein) synthase
MKVEKDVVITGVGMVTPLGTTARETAEAWRSGRAAERRAIPALAGTRLAGARVAVPPEFDPGARLGGRKLIKYMSDAAALGCVAAREAAEAADLKGRFRPERVGLFAGSGLAAPPPADLLPLLRASIDEAGRFSCRLLGERGLAAANPLWSFKILANMPACLVSILESVKGPNLIFTPWENGSAAALVEAWRTVAGGEVDAALAGAADSAAHPTALIALRQSGRLGPRDVAASAAAYLVFERAETARRDGRPALARVVRLETADDAGPIEDPLAARLGRCVAAAPAVLLALSALAPPAGVFLRDAGGRAFHAVLEAAA